MAPKLLNNKGKEPVRIPSLLEAGNTPSTTTSSADLRPMTTIVTEDSNFARNINQLVSGGVKMGNTVMQRSAEGTDQYIVLIGNIPWKSRWQDLKDLVRKHTQNVERAEIYLAPDGRSRGFGYVRIRGREDAIRVIERLDGYEWDGRALMVKLGNEYDVCPTASTASATQPTFPNAMDNANIPNQVPVPYLPPQYHDPAAMQAAIPPEAPQSQISALHQCIAMQAFLHYNARAINHGARAEYSRRQAEEARNLGNDNWMSVLEHQRAAQMHAESQVRAQNQAFVAHHLAEAHLGTHYRGMRLESHQGQTIPVLSPLPYVPLPGVMMPATGIQMPGFSPQLPGQEQFMVAINPSHATVDPSPIYVTPDRGLPVNLTHGAVLTESRGVFIGNLAYETEWRELKEYLKEAGRVTRCDVPQGANGRGKGYGTAIFESAEEAQRACNLFDSTYFKGRCIRVRLDRFATRKNSKPETSPNSPVGMTRSGPLVVDSSSIGRT